MVERLQHSCDGYGYQVEDSQQVADAALELLNPGANLKLRRPSNDRRFYFALPDVTKVMMSCELTTAKEAELTNALRSTYLNSR